MKLKPKQRKEIAKGYMDILVMRNKKKGSLSPVKDACEQAHLITGYAARTLRDIYYSYNTGG